MIHNEKRAKNLRLNHMEAIRSIVHQDSDELPDSLVALHVSSPSENVGERSALTMILDMGELPLAEEASKAFEYIIKELKDEDSFLSKLNLSEDSELVGLSIVNGVHSLDGEMRGGDGSILSKGVKVVTTFVDDSFAMYIVEENGMVGFSGCTHPLPIDYYKIERTVDFDRPEIREAIQKVNGGLQSPKGIEEKAMDSQYYITAILSAMASTREEINLFW